MGGSWRTRGGSCWLPFARQASGDMILPYYQTRNVPTREYAKSECLLGSESLQLLRLLFACLSKPHNLVVRLGKQLV